MFTVPQNLKGILLGIVIAIVGILVIQNVFYKKENKALIKENNTQVISIQTKELTIKEEKKSASIVDSVIAKNVIAKNDIFVKQRANEVELNKEVSAITKKYTNKAASEENKIAYNKEISEARIRSLWKTFCEVAKTSSSCISK